MEKMVTPMVFNRDFYKGKRVFITGHTGFKGSWLSHILKLLGADVYGYSLFPPTSPSLFEIAGVSSGMHSYVGDIRDYSYLHKVFEVAKPEIVFHLAAQPIVREGYKFPVETYSTNVMGTVNILECVRHSHETRSVVNITTDKVYQNNDEKRGYKEDDPLDGFDPYSNSKSCSELVTHCYKNAFFSKSESPAISTVRAGNVIGGGDFASDRIIPDCIKAAILKDTIIVRNPNSVRPYQHVLESLFAYLLIAAKQYDDKSLAGWYNVGPDDCDCVTTGKLVDLFCKYWGDQVTWKQQSEYNAPHESSYLKLDCTKLKSTFQWTPRWQISLAIAKTCEWTKAWITKENIPVIMDKQIREFIGTQSQFNK